MKNVLIGLAIIAALVVGFFIGQNKTATQTTTTSAGSDTYDASNIVIMDSPEIKTTHKNFLAYKKKSKDDSLTIYMTIKKDVFKAIGNYFSHINTSDTLMGVRAIMIRYDSSYTKPGLSTRGSKYEVVGKKYVEQNSIVFVPVNKKGKAIYNLWTQQSLKMVSGYNHSQLCPDSCYTDQ